MITKNHFSHLGMCLRFRMMIKMNLGCLEGCLGFKMVTKIHLSRHGPLI